MMFQADCTIIQYISLRYQLKPYVSRLFQTLQSSGRAIVRGLFFDFSNDPTVVKGLAANDPAIVHQYMFGRRIYMYIFYCLIDSVKDRGFSCHPMGCKGQRPRRFTFRFSMKT